MTVRHELSRHMPGVALLRWEFLLTVALPTLVASYPLALLFLGGAFLLVLDALDGGGLDVLRGTWLLWAPGTAGFVGLLGLWGGSLIPRRRLGAYLLLRVVVVAALLTGLGSAAFWVYGLSLDPTPARGAGEIAFWASLLVLPLWPTARILWALVVPGDGAECPPRQRSIGGDRHP